MDRKHSELYLARRKSSGVRLSLFYSLAKFQVQAIKLLKPSMAHLAWCLLKPSRVALLVASTYPAQLSFPS